MNLYLLIIDVVLAVAVIYLLIAQKHGKGRFAPASEGPEGMLKDPVTKLYSRMHLLQRLQETMARSERDKKSLAVVLWDVDGFSAFNNEYGKKEGDRLLQQVAAGIKKTVRVYDEVFRSGPDEFCAILFPGDKEVAEQVTKRVSQLVSKELFDGETEYAKQKFSMPAGSVFYPSEYQTVDSLLFAAKQALYKTKTLSPASN